jgi:hypothetical protein
MYINHIVQVFPSSNHVFYFSGHFIKHSIFIYIYIPFHYYYYLMNKYWSIFIFFKAIYDVRIWSTQVDLYVNTIIYLYCIQILLWQYKGQIVSMQMKKKRGNQSLIIFVLYLRNVWVNHLATIHHHLFLCVFCFLYIFFFKPLLDRINYIVVPSSN